MKNCAICEKKCTFLEHIDGQVTILYGIPHHRDCLDKITLRLNTQLKGGKKIND